MKRCIIGPVTVALVVIGVLAGCETGKSSESHEEEVEAWYAKRIAGLTSADGWLSLTGLFWLQPGANTFGGGPGNDLRFPGDGVPDRIGTFYLEADSISALIEPEAGVAFDGEAGVRSPVLSDLAEEPTRFELGSLRWHVIDRDGRKGVRLMDENSAARRAFTGTERYPISADWRVPGRFVPFDSIVQMEVPTELGTTTMLPSSGIVEFELDGQTHRLQIVGEPEDERLWIIFADPTNRTATYPAGRYVYIDAPDSDGNVTIDFNMAYSPPCAFSVFATCPFPPPQNRLSVPVIAGELRYAGLINE